MLAPLSGTRVVSTRFTTADLDPLALPLPGTGPPHQAVEHPARAIRLTLFERLPDPGEHRDDRRAA
jgi:hypothetical protein